MKKRFIICIDSSTNDQVKMFSNVLNNEKIGWWHWLKNTWLITDGRGKTDAVFWRNLARTYFKSQVLVIEISENHDTWSGFGNKDMFDWIKENWKKDY